MIYFIEHDSAETIFHVCADPNATIVPLDNRVTFNKADGTPNVAADGTPLSPNNLPLLDPVGIDAATYALLIKDGMSEYRYNPTISAVEKRPASGA